MSDLANIHIKTLKYINKNSKSLILNCGYGKPYSVLDIVNLFKKKKKCIVVKTEHINNKDYIIEDTTGIIFDGNIKKPTVIGKKLGDNSIHFLDPVDKTTTESSTETDNIEQNHIVNILSKLGNIEPTLTKEYDDFNINNVSSNNITIPTEYIEDKEYCVEIDY